MEQEKFYYLLLMMKIKMKFLQTLFFLGLFTIVFSSNVMANSASNELINFFKKINTICGNFTQIITDQTGHTISTSKGKFILQRPNHFRWEVLTPLKQLTIMNGKTVWLYQPDLEQVTESPISEKIGQTPLAILSGSTKTLTEHYNVSKIGDTFILIPKTNTTEFHQVKLTIQQQKIIQMVLLDSFSQKTVLNFTDVILNAKVKPQFFVFVIPKGVDVIKD